MRLKSGAIKKLLKRKTGSARRPSLSHRCPVCGTQHSSAKQRQSCLERHLANV